MLALSGLARANEQKILVLGDSISAAHGMSLEQGWVAQLASLLQEQNPPYSVVNASISGETTGGGLRRLPALLHEYRPDVVMLELGANDGMRGFPLQTLAANLTELVTLSQHSGARVLLLPMEIPPNYGPRYTKGFRETFQTVAAATGCVVAPFILDNIAVNVRLMQDDGLHPTVEAQALILRNVLPTLTDMLGGS